MWYIFAKKKSALFKAERKPDMQYIHLFLVLKNGICLIRPLSIKCCSYQADNGNKTYALWNCTMSKIIGKHANTERTFGNFPAIQKFLEVWIKG